ncbi:MAG: hypothetical protein LBS37_03270, partial [Treponema sp.]|nr:hypothetical protein [Treponema sp.]
FYRRGFYKHCFHFITFSKHSKLVTGALSCHNGEVESRHFEPFAAILPGGVSDHEPGLSGGHRSG